MYVHAMQASALHGIDLSFQLAQLNCTEAPTIPLGELDGNKLNMLEGSYIGDAVSSEATQVSSVWLLTLLHQLPSL